VTCCEHVVYAEPTSTDCLRSCYYNVMYVIYNFEKNGLSKVINAEKVIYFSEII